MTPTILLVARHGNTFGPDDVVTRVGGRTDLPLVESGLQQARNLGAHLKAHDLVPNMVFTSAMQRTIRMAKLAQEVMDSAAPSEILHNFNEIDYGPDENRPEDEVVARLGQDVIDAWDNDYVVPEGWIVDVADLRRTWKEFGARLQRDYAGKTILMVTHNGIARFADALVDGKPLATDGGNAKLKTGALGQFECDADGNWSCTAWNVRPAAV